MEETKIGKHIERDLAGVVTPASPFYDRGKIHTSESSAALETDFIPPICAVTESINGHQVSVLAEQAPC